MKVLIDTSVLSLALRRHRPDPAAADAVRRLSERHAACTIGPVKQELLSGIVAPETFSLLRTRLRLIPDLAVLPGDYEDAADLFNRCRRRGVQGDHTDFLIAAVARRASARILTNDRDFAEFARVVPLNFFGAGELSDLRNAEQP